VTALRRALNVDEDALQEAMALIQGCQPRPGSSFQSSQPKYIVPDVFVKRIGQGWAVEINPASVPRLKVNQSYAGVVARSADYASLRAQLQEARWLIRSLEIRNETLLKVARTIVQRQSAFLEKGDEAMEPMILRDVAEAVSMHESTISRVTTGKYMHTPRGFSSSGIFSPATSRVPTAATSPRSRSERVFAASSPTRMRPGRSRTPSSRSCSRRRESRLRGGPWRSTANRSVSPRRASAARRPPGNRRRPGACA
jgi:RNA polymerase sigma-54 factor